MEARVTPEGRPDPTWMSVFKRFLPIGHGISLKRCLLQRRVDRRFSFCYHQNTCSAFTRRRAMTRKKSPSWVLELPLAGRPDQAKHLEAARCLYNALLGEAKKRLNRMRSDPAWQEARTIPRTRKQERSAAFSRSSSKMRAEISRSLAGTPKLM